MKDRASASLFYFAFVPTRNALTRSHDVGTVLDGSSSRGSLPGRPGMPNDHERLMRDLFAPYLANDPQPVADALPDAFRFTSAFDEALAKPAYFERCWRDTGWIARPGIERIFVPT